MAAGYIAVQQSSTPDIKMQSFRNTVGGNSVDAEAVTPVDSSGAEILPATATQVGEVQASPTSNTILDRLKQLLTGIVLAAGSAIIGKVGIDQTADGTTNLVRLGSETTKVIGTVNISTSQTVTANNTAATTVVSTALEASHVLKSSAGSLVSLSWLNTKTSAQYLLIMNSTTVPSDGAVTLIYPPIYMPPTSNGMLEFKNPLVASTGISVSNSSTGTFTKTIGSSDCVFSSQVI